MGTPMPNPVCQTRNFLERPNRIRNKLKQSLLSKFAQTNPSIPITSVHGSYIDCKLQELFQSFQTPRHPPYALMIHNAVMELNEEGGSCKEDISGFIEKVFEGLPWAHQTILGHHLRKLCENQELVRTECGKYMLLPQSSDLIAGREMGMEKRVTSECEFGGSKDAIEERREEIDGKTESHSQIKEAAERSDLQEIGQEQVNQVQHCSKEHPQQNAEEHLELKDQVQVAEAQTEQQRQENEVTEGQPETTVELSGDMLIEGEKSELIQEPEEDEAHDVRTDVGHGEPEVSKEKAKNTSEMWELATQNLDEEQKLKAERHLQPTTHICPNVDLPSFDYTSKLAAALQLERTARSESSQVNRLPDKLNEVSLGETRPNDPPLLETNSPSLLYSSEHQIRGGPPKENGNMDTSAEMAVTADAANLEQQATPVHMIFNQMKDLGCRGENSSPLCVPDEEQTLHSPIQLQCKLGGDSKESTAATATSDVKQTACPGSSGPKMPNSSSQLSLEPLICPYEKSGIPLEQKLDASPLQALSAPNFYSSEYHGQHQSRPRKRGRPPKKMSDSESAGDIGDRKEAPSHLEMSSRCQLNPEDQTPLQHLEFATPDHKNQVQEQTAGVGSSEMEMVSAPSILGLDNDRQRVPPRRPGRPPKQMPGSEPVVKKQKLKSRDEIMAQSSEYRKKLRQLTGSSSKGSDLEKPSTSEKNDRTTPRAAVFSEGLGHAGYCVTYNNNAAA